MTHSMPLFRSRYLGEFMGGNESRSAVLCVLHVLPVVVLLCREYKSLAEVRTDVYRYRLYVHGGVHMY